MTDRFKNRISISKTSSADKGIVCGRVLSSDEGTVFIADQSGSRKFINACGADLKSGDIILLEYIKEKKHYNASSINILNSPVNNPVKDHKSLFHKLHKNGMRMMSVLKNRQDFFKETRDFFFKEGFIEMHTPTLVQSPGIEKHIEPFWTNYFDISGKDELLFLPSSPEFSLKEALVSGLEKIFEIAKVFRNAGENSELHNPEFFMLEWYRAYENYETIMDDCIKFLDHLNKNVYRSDIIAYKGAQCRTDKIQKIKVSDLFAVHKVNLDDFSHDPGKFIASVSDILKLPEGYDSDNNLTKEDMFFKLFLDKIEPGLGFDNPVIVYEYPVEMASLSETCRNNTIYAKRFEMYICGVEIANAYQELTDPAEQEKRFADTLQFRYKNKKVRLEKPAGFLNALKHGMPPSSGIALGLDRLFMLFEGLTDIKESNLHQFHK